MSEACRDGPDSGGGGGGGGGDEPGSDDDSYDLTDDGNYLDEDGSDGGGRRDSKSRIRHSGSKCRGLEVVHNGFDSLSNHCKASKPFLNVCIHIFILYHSH